MKHLLCILFFLSGTYMFSQEIYFNNRYDYNNNLEVIWTVVPMDSGYICVGGYNGLIVQHINLEGDLIWQKAIEDSNYYYFTGLSNSFIPASDGYAVGGSIKDTTGDSDGFLIKFDQNFDSVWTKRFNWQHANAFYQCKQTVNGEYILIGIKDLWGNGAIGTWLVKTDSLGNVIWDRTYTGSGSNTVMVTKDGFYVFANGDALTKTDTAGNIIWNKILDVYISNLYEAANGDYIGCYGRYDTTLSGSYPQYTPALIRTDTAGNIVWQYTYGPSRYGAWLTSVFETPEGDIIAAGQSNHNNTGGGNGYPMGIILKVNSEGDSLWYREYEYKSCEMNMDYLRDIKPTSDGGFIAAGFTVPNSFYCAGDSGQQDMWVIKMDSCGCLTPLCDSVCAGLIEDTVNTKEKEREKDLFTVYPNPANNSLTISYKFSEKYKGAFFTIHNTIGEIIKYIPIINTSGLMAEDISSLPGGVFFYTVIVNNNVLARGKLLVIKSH